MTTERPLSSRPAMAVIVMGYRDEATIERAVRSVIEQESPEPFEVIVVTSGGDRSGAIVRERFPEIQLIESEERLLPGGARNVGIDASDADIIAFLAADCIALPGWVAGRLTHHRSGHVTVASAIVPGPADGIVGVAEAFSLFPARLPGHPEGPATHGQSFGLSYLRSFHEELGPFDATLRTGEDSRRAKQLAARGIVPWFDPAILTAHPGSPDLRKYLGDQHRRGGLRFGWERMGPWGRGLRAVDRAQRVPLLRAVLCMLLSIKNTPHRVYWTVRSAVGGAPSHWLLLRCAPIMAAGIIANQVGWAAACNRSADRDACDVGGARGAGRTESEASGRG